MKIRSLCVYCGSSPGLLPEYKGVAEALGMLLAQEGIVLVYGGGNVGLMGTVADSALANGGKVVGVIPKSLIAKEVAHTGLTELRAVKTMHERKHLMAELSDAFVALPGGVGTIEEIFEVFTWSQLGFHKKPCAILNTAGYYDHLLRFLDRMVDHRFCKKDQMDAFIVETDINALVSRVRSFVPVTADKWMDR